MTCLNNGNYFECSWYAHNMLNMNISDHVIFTMLNEKSMYISIIF